MNLIATFGTRDACTCKSACLDAVARRNLSRVLGVSPAGEAPNASNVATRTRCAHLAKLCGTHCVTLTHDNGHSLYRWYPGAGFSCSKGSITVSSNLTVYRLKPVNKPQYLTRDVLAITHPRPPNFNVGHDSSTRRFFFLLHSQH